MEVVFNGGVRDIFRGRHVPPIHDIVKTSEMLAETGKSFSRFGDGELKLMTEPGANHTFQRGSERLSARLREVLTSDEKDLEVGVNRIYFYYDGFDNPHITEFIYHRGYGRLMLEQGYDALLTRDHYYDSVFSIPLHHYKLGRGFFDEYYSLVKRIWEGRNVYLVTGDAEIMQYDFNIIAESARSVRLVEIARTDAFDYHERILRYIKTLGISKRNDVILLVCGFAATILAYDLAECGYRAIDVGHLAKEYYGYRHGVFPYSMCDRGFF